MKKLEGQAMTKRELLEEIERLRAQIVKLEMPHVHQPFAQRGDAGIWGGNVTTVTTTNPGGDWQWMPV